MRHVPDDDAHLVGIMLAQIERGPNEIEKAGLLLCLYARLDLSERARFAQLIGHVPRRLVDNPVPEAGRMVNVALPHADEHLAQERVSVLKRVDGPPEPLSPKQEYIIVCGGHWKSSFTMKRGRPVKKPK
jgi:hypothetical protein